MAIVESWRFYCVPLFFLGWKCAYKKTFLLQRKISVVRRCFILCGIFGWSRRLSWGRRKFETYIDEAIKIMESYGIFFLLASISSNHLFQEEHHLYYSTTWKADSNIYASLPCWIDAFWEVKVKRMWFWKLFSSFKKFLKL